MPPDSPLNPASPFSAASKPLVGAVLGASAVAVAAAALILSIDAYADVGTWISQILSLIFLEFANSFNLLIASLILNRSILF